MAEQKPENEYNARLVAEQLKISVQGLPVYMKPTAQPILDGLMLLCRLLVEYGRQLDELQGGRNGA